MRTIDEIKESAVGLEDLRRERKLAPSTITDERLVFICACAEDDMSDAGWKNAFTACIGKTEQEIVEIMFNLTTAEVE